MGNQQWIRYNSGARRSIRTCCARARSSCGRRTARPDPGERWPPRLVATEESKRGVGLAASVRSLIPLCGPASAGLFSSVARNRRAIALSKTWRLTASICWRTLLSPVSRGTSRLMLPRGQDFESAVAEFDHVFSRIPRQVRTGQDGARIYVQSSAGRGVLERFAGDASAATPSAR
jgi:hypothetical protein